MRVWKGELGKVEKLLPGCEVNTLCCSDVNIDFIRTVGQNDAAEPGLFLVLLAHRSLSHWSRWAALSSSPPGREVAR